MQNSDNTFYPLLQKGKGKPFMVVPFFIFLLFSLPGALFGQKHDIGLGLGAANYTGDLVRTYSLRTHRPAGWAFYRYNLNKAVSFRGSVGIGGINGSDTPAYDAFAKARNRPDFNTLMTEMAATVEYNFLDYKDPKARIRWSPYFFGGIALFMNNGYPRNERATSYSKLQPSIPVGIGFKYLLSPYFTLGFEWGARKTFFDYIDNTGEFLPAETGAGKTYQYGNFYNKDWYYFTGITLSYTFWTIPCPYTFE